MLALALSFCIALLPLPGRAGTWTNLTRLAPDGITTMLLLPDGTVMCASDGGNAWFRLTPDLTGSYVNGTWSTLAPMTDTRLYYASQVLTNDGVFVAGGEYGTGTSSGEVYSLLLNAWIFCPGSDQSFSDNISETLPNGNVLVSPVTPKPSGSTIIYNIASNTWSSGGNLVRGSDQDEAAWVKLPDNSILTVDPFGTNSERYIPSLSKWVNDSTVPVTLYDPYGDELGPGFLQPNGTAIFFGSVPNTAIYTPSGTTNPGVWTAGTPYPDNQGMPDAPGAMLVTGNILLATSPTPTSGNHFPSPTSFYEYDTSTATFTPEPAPASLDTNTPTYIYRMLDLPDGTVLFSGSGSQLYVYQPGGSPLPQGQPTIVSIATNSYDAYQLTGTLLNGISEGAAYGDDAQMATAYPLVRLTNTLTSNVYYARTYGWSSTGVMTGSATNSTEFSVPPNLPAGTYSLVVVGNGNSSAPVSFTWAPDALQIPQTLGFAASGPTNGPFTPASAVYTLSNNSGSSLNWSAAASSNWLAISPASGALSPGQSSNIVVSLNTNADALGVGAYYASVSFTNLTSGAVQSFPCRLLANTLPQNGGFETGSVGFWNYNGDPNVHRPITTASTYVHSGYYGAEIGDSNFVLTLSQNFPTTPNQGYLLSFWLANPTASTANSFAVSWNGTNVLAETNLPAFGFTNFQFVLLATATNAALEFSLFNNTAYFGLDDISVNLTNAPPFILTQPAGETVQPGATVSFSVSAAGPGTLTYEWLRNSTPIAGATNSAYTTNNVQLSDSGSQFSCVVSNLNGATPSSNAVLTVTSAPIITMQPAGQNVLAGETVAFSVGVVGAQPLFYAWSRNSTPIPGATSASYSTNNVELSDSGSQFSCAVSNSFGSALSSNAVLTVSSQLVQNGGFETGSLSSWTQLGNTQFTQVTSNNSSYVHSGTYGAELGPGGSLGYLSQTIPTTPGQSYLLSLWLSSPDGQTPNEFLVSWNRAILYDQTNLPAFGWTNLVFEVTAATTNTTLELGFRDDPTYLGLDDIALAALPSLQTATAPGGSLIFTWNALVDSQYQLQYKTNLTQPGWIALGSPVTAATTTLTVTNLIASDAARFYRVVVEP